MKRNKFKRALHHLNKKHVVESAPTNSTLGVFSVTPSGVGPVGWTDREFTTDISGNPLPKLQTADFTVGDNPADSTEALDTSGLFAEDGTILTQTPPGDNSYILGPFSSMWYAWGNFTTLGYIRQSDRRMVNLGTITGKLSDWDGSSINSYGSLTLEQALWFRDVDKFGGIDNDPANHNFRARYPGPPSNTPDAFGRYLCVIAAGRNAGGTETRPAPPVNPTEKGEMNADDNFSAMDAKKKREEGEEDKSYNDLSSKDMDNYLDSLPPGVRDDLINGRALPDYTLDTLLFSLLPQTRVVSTAVNKINMAARALDKWWNKGRNVRVKGESTANWRDLMRDDLAQRGKSDLNFQTGRPGNPLGRPDQAFNIFRPASKGGPASGPTPAVRQAFERFFKLGLSKANQNSTQKESIQFSKQRILREIVIPEAKKKYKVKPKVIGHPSNKTLSNQMKDPEPTPAFKKEVPIWSMDQKMRNARESQEKKNEVLEYLGSSSDHWNYMTKAIKEHNKKVIKLNYGGKTKKVTRKEQVDNDYLVFMEDDDGNKSSMLQSKINETQSDEADKELFAKYYEMHPVKKKSLFKEVVKRGVFDYKGKPSKKGYPDKEPAQLDPQTGMHPEYGKKVKHDKIDSSTAESMPMQGNPEIDANIAKNINPEQKKRKMKILSQPNG